MASMFQLSPSAIRKNVVKCIQTGLVPFVTSSPGIGKSSIYAQIAEEFKLELIDLRLSQCAPEDLMGLPMRVGGKATFAPFDMFPIKGTPLPKGKDGWLLNLDEFNSAPRSVQAAAYKIVLDRMVGQYELHDNVAIAAAGNLASDRAIVNDLSTAMQSRLVHLEMKTDLDEFIEYATKAGFDHRVLGFLQYLPEKLHSFQPDHTDKTFACPRTWEFVSRLIKGDSMEQISLPLLAGTISEGVAIEFHTFLAEYARLPSLAAICGNPLHIAVPDDASTRYAVLTMLMDRFDRTNFPDVIKYVCRFPPEFQIIYFRGVAHRDPAMRKEKVYSDNIKHLVRFLNDDSDTATLGPVSTAA